MNIPCTHNFKLLLIIPLTQVVEQLVDSGADLSAVTTKGLTVFMSATLGGRTKIMKFLAEKSKIDFSRFSIETASML